MYSWAFELRNESSDLIFYLTSLHSSEICSFYKCVNSLSETKISQGELLNF